MRKYFVLWHFVQNFDRFNKVDRFIRVCDETRYFLSLKNMTPFRIGLDILKV